MRALLESQGYGLKELWSENKWAVDSLGNQTPTAFVLQDSEGCEVDAHAMRFDNEGNGIPSWANDEGLILKQVDLSGEGLIADVAVRCLSARMQVLCHTGYPLPDMQLRDLELLHARFGIENPGQVSRSPSAGV
jgi:lincosamide nucleotidyltransferase A/C/D/E